MKLYSKLIIFMLALFLVLGVSCTAKEKKVQASEAAVEEPVDEEALHIASIVVSKLPEEMHSYILDNMASFKEDLSKVLLEDPRFFIIADKKHLLAADYDPGELVSLDGKGIKVNKKGMKLEKVTFEALKKMLDDSAKEGLSLMVSSAYRDYKYQVGLYNYYISVYGKEKTDTFSAPPGASQHQLGTVVDFNDVENTFAGTKEEIWLTENAWKYGFSLSFPKGYENVTGYNWESWHFRYVTKAGAEFQKKYFGNIQHYMLLFLDAYRS
ncbi:MAG: M15 family metallopeptidase [Spirochaetia bacterium]|nr:M15 family metallopeptidase [Spirochaetia bacterium]